MENGFELDLENLPPIAAQTMAEVLRRLEAGENPSSILRELGVPEERASETQAAFDWIVEEATPEERALVRTHLQIRSHEAAWLEEWLRSGDPAADWGIVFLPDFSDHERVEALRRILARMQGPPIHPRRWNANRQAFISACEDMSVEVEDLEEPRGWEAVHDAIGHLTPAELRAAPDNVMQTFRSALQRLICDDLLPGHDWGRSRARSVPLTPVTPAPSNEAMRTEARVTLDMLKKRAGLTAYQELVWNLHATGYKDEEIARRLDRSHLAIRRVLSRVRSKLRDVREPTD